MTNLADLAAPRATTVDSNYVAEVTPFEARGTRQGWRHSADIYDSIEVRVYSDATLPKEGIVLTLDDLSQPIEDMTQKRMFKLTWGGPDNTSVFLTVKKSTSLASDFESLTVKPV